VELLSTPVQGLVIEVVSSTGGRVRALRLVRRVRQILISGIFLSLMTVLRVLGLIKNEKGWSVLVFRGLLSASSWRNLVLRSLIYIRVPFRPCSFHTFRIFSKNLEEVPVYPETRVDFQKKFTIAQSTIFWNCERACDLSFIIFDLIVGLIITLEIMDFPSLG